MRTGTNSDKKHVLLLRLLMVVLIGVTWYGVSVLKQTERTYEDVTATLSRQPAIVATRDVNGSQLKIPSYTMFKPGELWALVSKKRPLSGEVGYELVDIPVKHAGAEPMKIAEDISDELEQLVNAADADSEGLMVSSAYRSLAEQQKTYDDFVQKNGRELAPLYVSPVGASEHHTGLSVDFSSVSDECASDSNACSLSQSGAVWLAKNAYRYGFIQRYPEGEQATTGVAFEPWHYRFVGKPLAKAMNGADLTFDEVVALLAPGYTKSK